MIKGNGGLKTTPSSGESLLVNEVVGRRDLKTTNMVNGKLGSNPGLVQEEDIVVAVDGTAENTNEAQVSKEVTHVTLTNADGATVLNQMPSSEAATKIKVVKSPSSQKGIACYSIVVEDLRINKDSAFKDHQLHREQAPLQEMRK